MQTMMAGYSFAIAGGLIAQAPDANVGAAGILIGITGLIGGVIGGATTAFSKWAEYKLSMRRMDDWEAKANHLASELAKTQSELAESRQNSHDRADRTNGILVDLQERIGKNSETAQAVTPVVRQLAEQSGIHTAIPDPATAPDIKTITLEQGAKPNG